ncbi:MAG: hypothetical protein M0R06_13500, partial [Sphaerochaeta sp.]|nr:hypothetical protein [Sphaerochaeta sp.]
MVFQQQDRKDYNPMEFWGEDYEDRWNKRIGQWQESIKPPEPPKPPLGTRVLQTISGLAKQLPSFEMPERRPAVSGTTALGIISELAKRRPSTVDTVTGAAPKAEKPALRPTGLALTALARGKVTLPGMQPEEDTRPIDPRTGRRITVPEVPKVSPKVEEKFKQYVDRPMTFLVQGIGRALGISEQSKDVTGRPYEFRPTENMGDEFAEFVGGILPYVAASYFAAPLGVGAKVTAGTSKLLQSLKVTPKVAQTIGNVAGLYSSGAVAGGSVAALREAQEIGQDPEGAKFLESLADVAQDANKFGMFRVLMGSSGGVVSRKVGEKVGQVTRPMVLKAIEQSAVKGAVAVNLSNLLQTVMGTVAGAGVSGATLGILNNTFNYIKNPGEFDLARAAGDTLSTAMFFVGLDLITSLMGFRFISPKQVEGWRTAKAGAQTAASAGQWEQYNEACRILGLDPNNVTPETLKTAFRAASRKYHPDFGGTQEQMAAANEARTVLEMSLKLGVNKQPFVGAKALPAPGEPTVTAAPPTVPPAAPPTIGAPPVASETTRPKVPTIQAEEPWQLKQIAEIDRKLAIHSRTREKALAAIVDPTKDAATTEKWRRALSKIDAEIAELNKQKRSLQASLRSTKPPGEVPPVTPTGELWQISKQGALEGNSPRSEAGKLKLHEHRESIKQALTEGKPVPRKILEDYRGEPWADEVLAKKKPVESKKESWEMTWEEYYNARVAPQLAWTTKPSAKVWNEGKDRHERIIRKAISQNKPVPPEVLKDYPDLAAEKPAAPETKPAAPETKPAAIKVGQTVYNQKGEPLAVVDVSDPSLLTVRNAKGTEFKTGRKTVTTEKPAAPAETVPTEEKTAEIEAFVQNRWDSAKLGKKVEYVKRSGWTTKDGRLTKLGEKIAQSKWEDLSPAAQNVIRRRVAEDYPHRVPTEPVKTAPEAGPEKAPPSKVTITDAGD